MVRESMITTRYQDPLTNPQNTQTQASTLENTNTSKVKSPIIFLTDCALNTLLRDNTDTHYSLYSLQAPQESGIINPTYG